MIIILLFLYNIVSLYLLKLNLLKKLLLKNILFFCLEKFYDDFQNMHKIKIEK